MRLNDLFEHDSTIIETALLIESVNQFCEAMNPDGSFDFPSNDPDIAKFRGVKGINRDTGQGRRDAKLAKKTKSNDAISQAWDKLVDKVANSNLSGDGRQRAMDLLQKLAIAAKANNIELETDRVPDIYLNALKKRRVFEYNSKKKTNEAYQTTINLADPKAAFALKKARAKYAYSKSDLEAFVKMVHDDYGNMEKNQKLQDTKINNLERSSDHYKKRIQDLTTDVKELQRKIK
jgi:hypothetical protein